MAEHSASDTNEANYDVLDDTVSNKKERRPKSEVKLSYDSDSLVEDFEAKHDDDNNNNSDDDMFASDKEDAESDEKPLKKDQVQLLDLNEFEKLEGIGRYDEEQGVTSDQEHNVDNEEEYQEVVEYYTNIEKHEERVLKPKSAVKLEAFDLRDDAEEGDFDIDGNFIRRADEDEDANQDHWINETKTADVIRAREAHEKRERQQQPPASSAKSIEDLLAQLIEKLEPSETPLEAMARLRPRKQKRTKRPAPKVDDPAEAERKQTVFNMTDLCETLINTKGLSETYLLTREELMRKYKQETGSDYQGQSRGTKRAHAEVEESHGDKIWEFMWNGDETVNGPYSSYEMDHWAKTYFENNVTVRRLGEDAFRPLDEVAFSE